MAVDTGGTFTDFLLEGPDGRERLKLPSTPEDPAAAVLEGLKTLLRDRIPGLLLHGTTVATNALLERKGARTALVTTNGFEDLLEIGRQTRNGLYDLEPRVARTVIPREARFGLAERSLADGSVEVSPEEGRVRELASELRSQGFEAAAVCFLHSWISPGNEILVADVLRKAGIATTASQELSREYREYERFTTATLNAYLLPVMARYLTRIEENSPARRFRVMQSSGGVVEAGRAAREPVRALLSGPAGGVVGAFRAARSAGMNRVMTLDMGGTSTDVSLCPGSVGRRGVADFEGLPVRTEILDIHTVGAGGGSVAYLDEGGALRVGPRSSGAVPGPCCYGRGGEEPTVTDANLLLGILDPGVPLADSLVLGRDAAEGPMRRLAEEMGRSLEEVCLGIRSVVNASMVRALRVISVERGLDPREFTLVAFGGAGGLHAADLAEALGIPRVWIPPDPGVLSAQGMLAADLEIHRSRTLLRDWTGEEDPVLTEVRKELMEELRQELEREEVDPREGRLEVSMDLRYRGQSWEVALSEGPDLEERFHEAHETLYGYRYEARPLEIVTLRARARHPGTAGRPAVAVPGPFGNRDPERLGRVYVEMDGKAQEVELRRYRRDRLDPEVSICGPSVIHEATASTWVPPGWECEVDASAGLQLHHRGKK